MSTPIHVTDVEFKEKILNSEIPVVVDFWAEWCGPCRMVAPILDDLAKEYDGKITVAKVNVDENPNSAMEYGVRGIPTMLFFKDGEIKETLVGARPKANIESVISSIV